LKKLILGIICIVLLTYCPISFAQQDADTIVSQLNAELEKAKVFSPKELKGIGKQLKNMVGKGATKEGLKQVLMDLSHGDVKGNDLKAAVNSMNNLVNAGEKPKDAGNIVSQAAHQAKAQGLKGEELAARVHDAIKVRKAEREKLKTEKKVEKIEKREKSKGKNK